VNRETELKTAAEAVALDKILVGISSCLLGQEVRFDGGHKRDSYVNGTLSEYFDFVPFCPEAGVGLGILRQPIRLVRQGDEIRADRAHYADSSPFPPLSGPLRDAPVLSVAPSEGAHVAQSDLNCTA